MKKLFILLMVMFSGGFTKANPITPPRVISEFYMVNDSTWYLELVFKQPDYSFTNLDGFQIESSSGTAYIKNGITVTSDSEIVRILPVNTSISQNKQAVIWDGLYSGNLAEPGIYYCNLELDGRKVATGKIIIAK